LTVDSRDKKFNQANRPSVLCSSPIISGIRPSTVNRPLSTVHASSYSFR
jgi:hypothetical protein